MCGRYALGLSYADIQRLPGYSNVRVGDWINRDRFVPRYNIAPRSQAPVIRRRNASAPAGAPQGSDASNDSQLVLHTMKWGLVPHGQKREDNTLSTHNARAENLVEGVRLWGSIRGKTRCVIPCQGYYEWLKKGTERLPHFTRNEDRERLMLLAGLYSSTVLEGQTEPLYSFTIITTAAAKQWEWLHDRQPVILSSEAAVLAWLNTSSQTWDPSLARLLDPYHDAAYPLKCYRVPKEVGKTGTDSPSFIEPIAGRKDGIQAMFSKQASKSQAQQYQERKRKRSSTPDPETVDGDASDAVDAPGAKKVKVDKVNAWEDDNIEYIDVDAPGRSVPSTPKKLSRYDPSSPAAFSSKSPKKNQTSPGKTNKFKSDGNANITSFFEKT